MSFMVVMYCIVMCSHTAKFVRNGLRHTHRVNLKLPLHIAYPMCSCLSMVVYTHTHTHTLLFVIYVAARGGRGHHMAAQMT